MATETSQPEPAVDDADAADGEVAPVEEGQGEEIGRFGGLLGRVKQSLTPRILKIGAALTVGFLVCFALAIFMLGEDAPTNGEKLREALVMLKEGSDIGAMRLAQELQQQGYQDPDFPGGDQFILGIVAFRQAEKLTEDGGREQKFIVAKSFLEEAQSRALTEEYEPQWAYALGISLYRIGRAKAAQPLLEKAVEGYEPGKIESSLLLTDTYVYSKTAEDLARAKKINEDLTAMPELKEEQRDRALLQQAQILYAMDKATEAEAALAQVNSQNDGITILRAEVLIKAHKYQEALEKLRPVEAGEGLRQKFPRQARYLMGLCEQKLAQSDPRNQTPHLDAARNYYERTYKQFPGSHEAVAAQLWAADILRKQNFHEKALETYNDVLRQVHDPREFSNMWIDVKVFRNVILEAWNSWNSLHLYQDSIALADHMSPLFPPALASEYAALANQKAAQYLEDQLVTAGSVQRQKQSAEMRSRWIRSGQAFARLAMERKTTADYPDDLWTSAEHFIKGQDFIKANSQLKLFIETNPTKRLPLALVRQGEVLMHLNYFEDALERFSRVVENHAQDPVVFQARYLIGKSYFETDRHDLAEQTWREMLISDDLTPAAAEWQDALFGLGKVLHLTSVQKEMESVALKQADPAAAEILKMKAFRGWDEAVVRLEEYINRFDLDETQATQSANRSQAKTLMEVRYYLAKACQRSAELPREKMKLAETDNARIQFYQQMKQLLLQSNDNYQRLKTELLLLSDKGQIDELGLEMLRNCYFEIPNNYFTYDDYNGAVIRYREAAGRYQDYPEALRAMVQEANCYDRLGRPLDARGALAQAKFILEQIPDQKFLDKDEAMNKEQWRNWLQWAVELHNQSASR